MIQTTSLHDILWHFVASLTPSPCEPEDEEDEENKGNKENLEQARVAYSYVILLFVTFFNHEYLHGYIGKRPWGL